jgi:hypothetical protein
MGYERVSEVVAGHIQVSKEMDPSVVSEEEVVNYADKRVRHDRIVSLEERFNDLKDRYGRNLKVSGEWGKLEQATFEIEAKIFSILEINPNDLQHLQGEGYSYLNSKP